MINVLVVEDEPPILRGICKKIETLHPDYTVIDTAYNGQEAIDLLSTLTTRIDVVITDINMPVLNGIDLLKYIHAYYPSITSLVLSGYQDFDYVKKSFNYGAFDYITKPIDPHATKEVLKKVADYIYTQRADNMKQILSDALIQPIVTHQYQLPFVHCPLWLVLICSGPFHVSDYDYLLPGRSYWDQCDLSRIVGSMLHDDYWIIPGKSSTEKVLIVSSSTKPSDDFLHTLLKKLSNQTLIPISICAFPKTTDISTLYTHHHQLRKSLHRGVIFAVSSIVPFENSANTMPTQETKKKINNMLNSIPNQPTASATTLAIIDIIKDEMSTGLTQTTLQQLLTYICYSLFYNHSTSEYYVEFENKIDLLITNSYTLAQLQSEIEIVLSDFLSTNTSIYENKDDLVEKISEYISSHYTESISNQTLADKFGFVPSYISTIFKKYTGISPSKYLLNIRMEKAKELLSSSNNLLAKDVAELVGYTDPLYFSRVFKRSVGMTPSQYKENML